jgi:hypothetical protein
MITTMHPTRTADRWSLGRLLLGGLVAAVVAAIANLVLFALMKGPMDISFVIPFRGPDTEPESLPAAMVAIASAVPAIVAAFLLWIFGRTLNHALGIFQIVGLVALVLSLGGPLTLEDVATSTRLALIAMHIVAGAVIIGLLTWWAGRDRDGNRSSAEQPDPASGL